VSTTVRGFPSHTSQDLTPHVATELLIMYFNNSQQRTPRQQVVNSGLPTSTHTFPRQPRVVVDWEAGHRKLMKITLLHLFPSPLSHTHLSQRQSPPNAPLAHSLRSPTGKPTSQ